MDGRLPPKEAIRATCVRLVNYALPLVAHLTAPSCVHRVGAHQRQFGMVVHVIVVVHECTHPNPGILYGAEPIRKRGVVLHRLELRLRVGVVIRTIGS